MTAIEAAPTAAEPRLLTAQQAADRLGLTLWAVYHQARIGRIPSRRLGKSLRFLPAELDAFIEQLPAGGPR